MCNAKRMQRLTKKMNKWKYNEEVKKVKDFIKNEVKKEINNQAHNGKYSADIKVPASLNTDIFKHMMKKRKFKVNYISESGFVYRITW